LQNVEELKMSKNEPLNGIFLVALGGRADLGKLLDQVWEEALRREKFLDKMAIITVCTQYDQDPRELWNIPEGVEVFRRAIDAGLFGLMTIPTMFNKQFEVDRDLNPFMIAFAISRGVETVTPDMLPEFEEVYNKSCVAWNKRHPEPVKRCGTCKCVQFGPCGIGRSCARCGNRNQVLMCCARCHEVSYCGRACQRAHWAQHKKECRRCFGC